MKHQIKTAMAAAIMLCVTVPVFGVSPSYTIYLRPSVTQPCPDKDYNEEGEEGKHIPPRPVQCTIDAAEGVRFVGMEKPDIVLYEIYDLSGTCVASFGDESSFVDHLFALSGEYEIRLMTADWVYVGHIGL